MAKMERRPPARRVSENSTFGDAVRTNTPADFSAPGIYTLELTRTPKLERCRVVEQASSLPYPANKVGKIFRSFPAATDRQDACPTTADKCRLRSSELCADDKVHAVSYDSLTISVTPAQFNNGVMDVNGLEIDNFKAQVATGVAPSKFDNVSGLVIRNSPLLEKQ
jgi:hypothetical protein